MKKIEEGTMSGKRKQDLVFLVILILMIFALTMLFLLINNIWVRYFMYLILTIYSSMKVTEWLTEDIK